MFKLIVILCLAVAASSAEVNKSLVGTWDLESSENFDEYMKELGVGYFTRLAANLVKPTVYIEKSGAKWTVKLVSTLKSSEINFESGVPFDESKANDSDMLI